MGQESWEDFFGKDDSKEVLIQKAIELSSILINTTADDINYLFDKAEDFNLELKGESDLPPKYRSRSYVRIRPG